LDSPRQLLDALGRSVSESSVEFLANRSDAAGAPRVPIQPLRDNVSPTVTVPHCRA